MKAVVLVGGQGTRLRPLTLSTPKQMLPVGGRPMIQRVIDHLAGFGIDDAVEIELCESLAEISSAKFFYEALLSFASERIPFGEEYEAWKTSKRLALESGADIYFAGKLQK